MVYCQAIVPTSLMSRPDTRARVEKLLRASIEEKAPDSPVSIEWRHDPAFQFDDGTILDAWEAWASAEACLS